MYRQGLTNRDFVKALPYRFLKLMNKNMRVNKTDVVFNHKMYLDEPDSLNLAWYRIYEPFETNLMISLIKPGGVIVDLGANIGYYTLIFSKYVGKDGKVFAFEPSSSNFDILNNNVKMNGYTKIVTAEKKAVSNKDDEEITLYLNDNNHGMNRIYRTKWFFDKKDKQEKVKTIKLDTYFKKYNIHHKIDFIKMDLEGSEYGALTGMETIARNSLNKNLKLIVEFHPKTVIEYGKEPRQVIELLYSYGFNIWSLDIVRKKREKILLTNQHDLDQLIEKADKYTTNLLCEK